MHTRPVIALLLNSAGLRDDYQGHLRRGVEQACIERNMDLWVYAARNDWASAAGAQLQVFRLLSSRRVDGVIMAAGCIAVSHSINELLTELKLRLAVPLCVVGQRCPGVSSFVVDNQKATAALIEHLVTNHDRRRFACIAGPCGHQESQERLAGVKEALAKHGIALVPELVLHGDFMLASGCDLTRALIESGRDFDAIVAANDDMARGAAEVLNATSVRCPDEIAIVGFDDAASARIASPPLTTIRQPVARLGAQAVAGIVAAWQGSKMPEECQLPTDLVIRESCGCRPARAGAARSYLGVPTESASEECVASALAPVIEDELQRQACATALCGAARRECASQAGALLEATAELLARLFHPMAPLHQLQRVLSSLRNQIPEGSRTPSVEDAFHQARVLIGNEAARREARRSQRHDVFLEQLRISGEQLGTVVTVDHLHASIAGVIQRFGFGAALVAVLAPGDEEHIHALVCMNEGTYWVPPSVPYDAELLLPEIMVSSSVRRSLTIMPLSFESERLGVLVLDLPPDSEVLTLLREQIGGAIKSVSVYEAKLGEERLRSQAQEERRIAAERLRSVNLIAGGVAHDLNNVLGPLTALPEIILGELARVDARLVPEEVVEDLHTIQRAGLRAAATIRDLVSLGRTGEEAASVLEINRLLRAETASLKSVCEQEEGIRVSLELSEEPLCVRAIKSQLIRALSNLVANAVDAMHGQGVVKLRAHACQLGERREGFETVEPGNYAVIEVEDTGAGIAPADVPRIFEPFFTARLRRSTTGTGLGLTIVQRVVRECHGYLQVQSQVDCGSTFSIYLPLVRQGEVIQSEEPPPARPGTGSILVVDDEAVQLRTAKRILSRLGCSVSLATSGEEALALYDAAADGRRFDVVVMDVLMPGGISGVETVERMRVLHPDQRVVMVTGYAPEQLQSGRCGVDATWLSKPYSAGALAAAVVEAREPQQPCQSGSG